MGERMGRIRRMETDFFYFKARILSKKSKKIRFHPPNPPHPFSHFITFFKMTILNNFKKMIPKKKNGFRLLKIAPFEFYWKFHKGIDIRPKDNFSNRLKVDIGWYDEWLYVNDRENRPEPFEPEVVTPKFVRAMIEWALNNGWDVQLKNNCFQIRYHNGKNLIISYL